MSLASALLPAGLRLTGRDRPWRSREHLLRAIDRRDPWPAAVPALSGVAVGVRRIAGMPVAMLTPPDARGVFVHFHGGGYVFGPAAQHWSLARRLALASGRTVAVPLYPLAPQGAAAEVVPAAVEVVNELGRAHPGDLVIGGDSAGGGLALAVAQLLSGSDRRPPLALVAPWVDAALDDPDTVAADRVDPWLSAAGLRAAADLYRGALPADDPRVSPLRGPLGGLGRVTIITGTRDVLHPQALRLAGALRDAGTGVDLHVAPGLLHNPPFLPLPEARPYVRVLADLLRADRSPES